MGCRQVLGSLGFGQHPIGCRESSLAGEAADRAEATLLSGSSALYSPDGTRIVTASSDRTARLWDATSGAEIAVLRGHEGYVWSAAFSPDRTRIVTASEDKTARLWDAASGAEVAVLRGHDGRLQT